LVAVRPSVPLFFRYPYKSLPHNARRCWF